MGFDTISLQRPTLMAGLQRVLIGSPARLTTPVVPTMARAHCDGSTKVSCPAAWASHHSCSAQPHCLLVINGCTRTYSPHLPPRPVSVLVPKG
jgi:hypothetical protein